MNPHRSIAPLCLLLLLLGQGCSRQALMVIVPDQQNPTAPAAVASRPINLERREGSVLSPQSSVLISSSVLIHPAPPSCEEKEQATNPAPSPAEEWLYRQRAYPFGEIPPNGRRDAFEAVKRQRAIQSDAAGPSYVWRSLGPAPLQTRSAWKTATGRVTAVAISPSNPDIILAGASGGGIWRSSDGGAAFVPVADDQADLAVGSIAFAPSNPNVVYAGMGDAHLGTGVLRSTDAGATWRLVTTSAFPALSATRKIAVDPNDENVVWLAQARVLNGAGTAVPAGSLLKSIDGGATWTTAFNGVVWDFLVTGPDGKTLFVGVSRADVFGTGGIYRSTDGGRSWSMVYAAGTDPSIPPRYCLALSSGILRAIEIADLNATLLTSTDGGGQWMPSAGRIPPQSQFLYLAASPRDPAILYVGGVAALRSSDGGLTWTTLSTHVDQHAIAFHPADPSQLWLGNDGGLSRSNDGGATFEPRASLPIVQLYSVNAHPTDPDTLFGGSQDNGLERRNGASREWTEVLGGDFGTQLFDRADPSRILTNSIFANLLRFTGNGNGRPEQVARTETFGESDSNGRIGFIAPLAQGPDGTVWFGTWRLFASRDFGTTWTAPGGMTDLTAGRSLGKADVLSAIGIADSDASVVYTGSAQGRVMVTKDGGTLWTDITPPVLRAVTSIAVQRTDPAVAYAGLSGYRSGHVYKTTMSGAAWTDVSSGLPDVPVNALFIDRQDPRVVYAGTDIGVFRSETGGGNWHSFNSGLPPVIVSSFTTDAAGRLIAGTYGRGAYLLVLEGPAGPRRRAVGH